MKPLHFGEEILDVALAALVVHKPKSVLLLASLTTNLAEAVEHPSHVLVQHSVSATAIPLVHQSVPATKGDYGTTLRISCGRGRCHVLVQACARDRGSKNQSTDARAERLVAVFPDCIVLLPTPLPRIAYAPRQPPTKGTLRLPTPLPHIAYVLPSYWETSSVGACRGVGGRTVPGWEERGFGA
eukprot:3823765-Rhodomonas_salina.1